MSQTCALPTGWRPPWVTTLIPADHPDRERRALQWAYGKQATRGELARCCKFGNCPNGLDLELIAFNWNSATSGVRWGWEFTVEDVEWLLPRKGERLS